MELTTQRSAKKRTNIIFRNIKSNSIIVTDCWKGYSGIKNLNQSHLKINHKKYFIYPESNHVHTQNIENRWKHLKDYLKLLVTNNKKKLKKLY